jgi:predicted nucleotidyltransferase component of viral defense system
MTFIHEDPAFSKLLAVVGEARNLDESLVEKDYWITHTLWALENAGLEVWFKGGTCLSKGFGIIQRPWSSDGNHVAEGV